jgi:hypothetical protein
MATPKSLNFFFFTGALEEHAVSHGRRCAHWCSLGQERDKGSSPFGETTKAATTGGCLQWSIRQEAHRSGVVEARKLAGEEAHGSCQNRLGCGSAVCELNCHEGGGERPTAHWRQSVASASTAAMLGAWRDGELISWVEGQRA